MANILEETLRTAIIDSFGDKITEEKKTRTKAELLVDLDLFKSIGNTMTDEEYNALVVILNKAYEE